MLHAHLFVIASIALVSGCTVQTTDADPATQSRDVTERAAAFKPGVVIVAKPNGSSAGYGAGTLINARLVLTTRNSTALVEGVSSHIFVPDLENARREVIDTAAHPDLDVALLLLDKPVAGVGLSFDDAKPSDEARHMMTHHHSAQSVDMVASDAFTLAPTDTAGVSHIVFDDETRSYRVRFESDADAGGAVVVERDGGWVGVGIVSFVSARERGAYVLEASAFRGWIDDTVNNWGD